MIRFDFDNDKPLGSDDAYSAGWSLQAHSTPRDRWGGPLGSLLAKLPGMGDDGDGGRAVQRSFGITQLILTPPDLTIETFQPEDAPYAGILGIHGSWASYDNRRLVGLQLYGGCLGPCSQGERCKGSSTRTWAWATRRRGGTTSSTSGGSETRTSDGATSCWLRRTSVTRRAAGPTTSRWAASSRSATLHVSSKASSSTAWDGGSPMGFTHIPDPAPRGVVLDPVYLPVDTPVATSRPWRGYLSVVVRARPSTN